MDPIIGAALISGGFGMGSSFLNHFGGGQGSDTALNDQRFMNDFAWKQSLRNEDYMRNYMQYRTQDAEKAGIHPLAALGVNTGSGPSGAAFVGADQSPRPNAFDLGSDLAHGMGQNISRAVLAQKTQDEREMHQASLARVQAETDFIHAQRAESEKRLQAPENPANPSPYGTQTPSAGDVYKHINVIGPDGETSKEWSTPFAMSHIGRPVKSILSDVHDIYTMNMHPKFKAVWNRFNSYPGRSHRSKYGPRGER